MIVSVTWSAEPVRVYAIFWQSEVPRKFEANSHTLFTVLDGDHLAEVRQDECSAIEGTVDDFVMMPKSFDFRVNILMWRPLAEAGIWPELRDYDPDAVSQFRQLRIQHGLN